MPVRVVVSRATLSTRLIIVPRWSGRSDSDWYPWLTAELTGQHGFAEIRALDLPTPGTPVIDAWVAGIDAALGADPEQLARTVLVGHSVGCRAALLWLARLRPGLQLAGTACIAGWWTVDRPWPTIEPWIAASLDADRVRAASPRIVTLLSTDDPFTADFESNRAAWQQRLGAEVELAPGGKHFNGAEEPAVRELLVRCFGA